MQNAGYMWKEIEKDREREPARPMNEQQVYASKDSDGMHG